MKDLFPSYSVGHFINEPTNPTEFEITSFQEMNEPDVDEYHKHTFYELIWIDTGYCKQIIDYNAYTIRPKTLFFISPGQLHCFEDWQNVTGGSVMFTEDFFLLNSANNNLLFELSFLDNFYANPSFKPDEKNYREIKHTINLIFEEQKRSDRSQTIARALLHVLLSQIQRSIDSSDKQQPYEKKYLLIYKKFKVLLDLNFQKSLSASIYADKLSITPHHLNHIVKSITGNTVTAAIRQRSILEAKRLLTFSDYTIAEIAASLGYFDSSYFAKLFKSETSQSPQAFRSTVSEKYRTK
jgi:AraC family transcriptional activator of pobA